jgi:hypothetical protein
MNLSNWCKSGVTVLGGLAVLLSALTASAAAAPDEANFSGTSSCAEVERQQYHVYVAAWTRVGPEWTYFGSYDDAADADAVAQAEARRGVDERAIRIVAGSRLQLPPAKTEHVTYAVAELGQGISYDAPRYRSAAEAAAAAERIRAEGKRFVVKYFLYG